MKNLAHWVLGAGLAIAAGSGCDSETVEGPELSERGGKGGGGKWGCHDCGYTNSPIVESHDLGTVQKGGRSASMLVLAEIRDTSGNVHAVDVAGEAIVADVGGGNTLEGYDLLGWTLVFENGSSFPTTTLDVEILNYKEVDDWTGQGGTISTYSLAWFDSANGDVQTNVCPGLGLDETSVTLINDETYDAVRKEVHPGKTGLATFTCVGHALAKLKLLGRGPNDGYNSTWEERQSTLKMLTADYCGTGQSYTAVGQPLIWLDNWAYFQGDGSEDPAQIEARWDMDGAVCLSTPRLATTNLNEVETECGGTLPPPCDEDLGDFTDIDWITVNR